ncbi:Ionotropic glutamate receptor L-glutamate and glycine-binding domain, partial [Trinorchestia longiramus]
RFQWVSAVDGLWGEALPNGTFNGMVGMVQRKETDLALGPFGMTASRAAVVRFSTPVFYSYYRILLQRGNPQHHSWSFFK